MLTPTSDIDLQQHILESHHESFAALSTSLHQAQLAMICQVQLGLFVIAPMENGNMTMKGISSFEMSLPGPDACPVDVCSLPQGVKDEFRSLVESIPTSRVLQPHTTNILSHCTADADKTDTKRKTKRPRVSSFAPPARTTGASASTQPRIVPLKLAST